MGPPIARLCTWRGFRMYWNFRNIRSPCRPPDFGFMNTNSGIVSIGGVIWKDIAGCWVDELPELRKPPWFLGVYIAFIRVSQEHAISPVIVPSNATLQPQTFSIDAFPNCSSIDQKLSRLFKSQASYRVYEQCDALTLFYYKAGIRGTISAYCYTYDTGRRGVLAVLATSLAVSRQWSLSVQHNGADRRRWKDVYCVIAECTFRSYLRGASIM